MKPVDVLARAGGVLEARRLVGFTSRGQIRTALQRGEIVRDARGHYALPAAEEARRHAARLSAVITGLSAAASYGWELKVQPELPVLTVPRTRKVTAERRAGVELHWRDIPSVDVWNGVLLPGPAVIDVARTRPFGEALAVADSALRHRAVTPDQLLRLAERVPTTGRAQCLRVAREASPLAANPFESALRALALGVAGLDVEPQVVIDEPGFTGRPDLVDRRRRVVIEVESFEFHGRRKALKRDCERYTALVLAGWTVVRFAWEHVMFEQDYVAECLARLADAHREPQGHAASPQDTRRTA
ncbi:MAG: DUF559 domain-containing protein [Nocardioidaceae bacterium]